MVKKESFQRLGCIWEFFFVGLRSATARNDSNPEHTLLFHLIHFGKRSDAWNK